MINGRAWACAVLACLLLTAIPGLAEVKLPAVISDNMVLQQGIPVPIWGWADQGENVTVSICGQQISTTPESDGKWMVRLKPLKAGGPCEMVVQGKNRILIKNVLIGDVWIGSGQSNMEMRVSSCMNAEQEIKEANYPQIRLFHVPRKVAGEPQKDVEAKWVVCTPETIPTFSGALYFFGRDIHKTINMPVGLIETSWGGTTVEPWTSKEMLMTDPEGAVLFERWAMTEANYARSKEAYEKAMVDWKAAADKAKAENQPVPPEPKAPTPLESNPYRPAGLYNAMVAPLIPYAIKGVTWYQGEANAPRAYRYRTAFSMLIRDWRLKWGQGAFPFLFVQLAGWYGSPDVDKNWPELREAQLMALRLRNTGMAVAIDIGDEKDIHPKNKQEVGRRLALAAKAIAYGMDVVYSGPIYQSMSVEGDRIRLRFSHLGGGLVAKEGPLKGFVIAGEDRVFVPAEAVIDGDTVVVKSNQVAKPVAVRYAWNSFPTCNLYNKANLPASPFRTDDWPGVTEGK